MKDAIDNVFQLREALGHDADLCIELHRRLTVAEAVAFARAIEPAFPMFVEDPVPPEGIDTMALVADRIPVPIATGERFTDMHQFQILLARGGVHYLRPCICICGGITAGRKIAALAEANDTQIVPHNPLSPVSLAACLQLDAAISNFAIQEYPVANPEAEGYGQLRAHTMVTGLPEPVGGFLDIPGCPGLGIELVEDAERKYPRKKRVIHMRPHFDGSMIDQ